MKKYYDIIGVKPTDSETTIRLATRERLKEVIFDDEAKALEIAEAYVVLSNEREKKKYDETPDGEYKYDSTIPYLKKPDRIVGEVKSQVYARKFEYEGKIKKAMGGMVGGFAGFVLLTIVTLILLFAAGLIIYIIPIAAIASLGLGIGGISEYFKLLKNKKKFLERDIWEYVELPH